MLVPHTVLVPLTTEQDLVHHRETLLMQVQTGNSLNSLQLLEAFPDRLQRWTLVVQCSTPAPFLEKLHSVNRSQELVCMHFIALYRIKAKAPLSCLHIYRCTSNVSLNLFPLTAVVVQYVFIHRSTIPVSTSSFYLSGYVGSKCHQ